MDNQTQVTSEPKTPASPILSMRYLKALSFPGQKRNLNDNVSEKDARHHTLEPTGSRNTFTNSPKTGRTKSHSLQTASTLSRASSPFTVSARHLSRKRSKTPQARLVSDTHSTSTTNSVLTSSINTPKTNSNNILLTPLSMSLNVPIRTTSPSTGRSSSAFRNNVRARSTTRKTSQSVIERPSDLSILEILEELSEESDSIDEERLSSLSLSKPASPPTSTSSFSAEIEEVRLSVPIPPPPPPQTDPKAVLVRERSVILKQQMIQSETAKAKKILSQPLLSGELVSLTMENILEVTNFKNFQSRTGTAFVTNYRFILQNENFYWSIPLGAIDKIKTIYDKLPIKDTETFGFCITCRYPFIARLYSLHRTKIAILQSTLSDQTFTPHLSQMFAFRYFESLLATGAQDYSNLCWGYNILPDYSRLGLDDEKNGYNITELNKNYKLCKTYPSQIVLPANCPTKVITAVANFRSRSRLPAITWRHPTNNQVIVRCAQPLCGIIGNRSKQDEKFMEIFAEKSTNNQVYLFDCRSQVNAYANKLKGAGTEARFAYRCCRMIFLKIENIHVMRTSQKKLFQAVLKGGDPNESGWLEHISLLLTGALRVAQLILSGSSIIVHCSDGWDRTPQLVGLAEIILDPYYRTIKGFEMLIDKEWLSFGHMFYKRTGYGDLGYRKKESSQKAPIFLQFIDAVWQLLRQSPGEFEFNEMFLVYILYHSYSCLFGTFLCNSEKERSSLALFSSTCSLWQSIQKNLSLFLNTQFLPVDLSRHQVLLLNPKTDKSDLLLWNNYYYSNGHFPWDFLDLLPV
jgi:myotubularin-related protein 1/2